MKMRTAVLAALAAATMVAAANAPVEARIRAGLLRCDVAPSVGYIVGSEKSVSCVFTSVRGYKERYSGTIIHIGLDVGYTKGGRLAWAVYAPAKRGRGALAGSYGGASAEATVGGGVGTNVLVGGFERSISLQPVSVGAQHGLNLAVTVSGMELNYVRR